jgi:hypothetical protein
VSALLFVSALQELLPSHIHQISLKHKSICERSSGISSQPHPSDFPKTLVYL